MRDGDACKRDGATTRFLYTAGKIDVADLLGRLRMRGASCDRGVQGEIR